MQRVVDDGHGQRWARKNHFVFHLQISGGRVVGHWCQCFLHARHRRLEFLTNAVVNNAEHGINIDDMQCLLWLTNIQCHRSVIVNQCHNHNMKDSWLCHSYDQTHEHIFALFDFFNHVLSRCQQYIIWDSWRKSLFFIDNKVRELWSGRMLARKRLTYPRI